MKPIRCAKTLLFSSILWFGTSGLRPANAQTAGPQGTAPVIDTQAAADLLKKLDQLVEQNTRLEQQNKELMDQIEAMRKLLAAPAGTPVATSPAATPSAVPAPAGEKNEISTTPTMEGTGEGEAPTKEDRLSTVEGPKGFGSYTPNFGFKVADTKYGDLNISIYTYARYLNQLDLAPTYTNYFGVTSAVQRRQDVQLNKVQIKFLGWLMDPKFRYFLYAWSSNPNQGQGAQVVLAGNLNYEFSKYFTLSGGIRSLPGTRSVEGNFPFWLGVDTRLIADEFFRPSYTDGIWAQGQVTDKTRYQVMVGNNLSILGVNAGQLPNNFSTVSSSFAWMPTTGEFGPGFGDFEDHKQVATRIAVHYTRSREDKQSQPNSEAFENTQIRLADGTIVFTPNIFGPGLTVTDVTYQMSSIDGGVKYHGFALEGEGFFRWLSDFRGAPGVPTIFNQGFQAQLSMMVTPKALQLYSGGSMIFGNPYGTPYDARIGTNFFPFHNKVVRWNTEALYLFKSPVGYYAVPFVVGGKGWVFHTNMEMAF
ncbi:MAG: hypothetical protein ABSD20_07390 [Terriglobales bacterium]|jgi:hypothetical protein